ncbi:peptidase U32 family protein [Desulfoluna spongiiphila]|uniref:peptidase U32 family protein n=1 Tax=Desulfoluna spongiiphila TaxID=419481 RepID=UPI0012573CB7|nr:U32 family peptidase [Desulfoluna spongiiphila]VVS90647.1 peptidase u32 [Desulfoluna spongiiphila]
MEKQRIELLSPARDLACGKEAINHGADAVYIGAPKFGARAAAGNTLEDIEALCAHGRLYGASVHVTMNTLLFDGELDAAREQAVALWSAGVDALIIQDMAFLEMDLPPIALHASTQTDNRTPERVKFLEDSGFERVILARELSLDTIRTISDATTVPLEAFVHGALCVSYSGQCWMSAALGGRSANRGTCGQPCRLAWDLKEASGKVVSAGRHLLSLKDMDRSAHIGPMLDAGISSFKIEGRLKSQDYVKNVTAFYRQALDRELDRRAGSTRVSFGRVTHHFTPNIEKSFFRGGTDYYLSGKRGKVASPDTPKAMGERMGQVVHVAKDHVTLKADKGRTPVVNGDGLCFLDPSGNLKGIKANRVDGGLIRPSQPVAKTGLFKGAVLYRNFDHAFLKLLEKESAERRLAVDLSIKEVKDGLWIAAADETGRSVTHWFGVEPVPARDKDKARKTLETQLAKLGGTPFYLRGLTLNLPPLFIPVSEINRLRREVVALLLDEAGAMPAWDSEPVSRPVIPFPETRLTYRANVANALAKRFYTRRGVSSVEPAFEATEPEGPVTVMETRHCIREALGLCKGKAHQAEPLVLENEKGRFTVHFLCGVCGMRIEKG